MVKDQKNHASKAPYISPNHLELVGFESPFTKNLDPDNRWVKLVKQIPWDKIANVYQKQLNNSLTGADGINPRVAIGSKFIKRMCDLSDRETVQQIQENVYMQYFKRKEYFNRLKNLQFKNGPWGDLISRPLFIIVFY